MNPQTWLPRAENTPLQAWECSTCGRVVGSFRRPEEPCTCSWPLEVEYPPEYYDAPEDEEEHHGPECCCETCLQNHPERDLDSWAPEENHDPHGRALDSNLARGFGEPD